VKLKFDKELGLTFAIIPNDQDMLLASIVGRLYARLGDKIRSIHIDFTKSPSWLAANQPDSLREAANQ
jgi:hypothetical protein